MLRSGFDSLSGYLILKFMTDTEKLKILKQGKKLFVEHPEYWGMCFCLEHAMAGTERGIVKYDERDIVATFPEFNRKFLNAPKNRESKAYWWEPDTESGHDARVAAFDKLIETYEHKINHANS